MMTDKQKDLSGFTQGYILKGIGGFYYVETAGGVIECKARGIFRKNDISPYPGDNVAISLDGDVGTIEEILPRRNFLVRPTVSNVDRLVIVVSTADPTPNLFVIDKLTAVAVYKDIEPVIVITKTDLSDATILREIYNKAGFRTFSVNCLNGNGSDEVRSLLADGVSVLCGNSGVGKSSLLNCIYPSFHAATASISTKLGRGRHTTRQVELYKTDSGSYVADTPGFSTVDIARYEVILKENLENTFPEFAPYLNNCKFTGCSHTTEKGCAIIEGVKQNEIDGNRHENYRALYSEAKNIKEWELPGYVKK